MTIFAVLACRNMWWAVLTMKYNIIRALYLLLFLLSQSYILSKQNTIRGIRNAYIQRMLIQHSFCNPRCR
jgi:hypothetical protein